MLHLVYAVASGFVAGAVLSYIFAKGLIAGIQADVAKIAAALKAKL